mmetsp:Transcript_62367/g.131842  ORF Transcript_62367/g.131842 Transcript_62367/m.131842 type:complete len:207 (+) Transcript_62367:507-1127(+)
MEFLKGSKSGYELFCLSDHPRSQESIPRVLSEAVAIICLLSLGTLNSQEELRIIDQAVAIQDRYDDGRTMIPVHMADFAFPTRQYFEVAMPQLFPGENTVPIAKRLKSCLKRISIMLPMAASEDVLITQAQSVFQRLNFTSGHAAYSRSSSAKAKSPVMGDSKDSRSTTAMNTSDPGVDSTPVDFKTTSGQDDMDFVLDLGFGAAI